VEKSRELKKSLLAESKGKGRGAKNEPAKPASADAKSAKHRKGPPRSGAPSTGGGPRKRKAKS
jgi:ribonuclease R